MEAWREYNQREACVVDMGRLQEYLRGLTPRELSQADRLGRIDGANCGLAVFVRFSLLTEEALR